MLRFFVSASVAVIVAGSLHAGSFTNDFTNPNPVGFTLNGGTRPNGQPYPAIENGILALTYAENSEQGTIILDELDPGATVGGFTARFKVRVGGGSSTPADGFAFYFGSDIDPSVNFGEEGPTSTAGVTVAFDIFDNGASEAPAIDIKVNGEVIAHTPFTIFEIISDTFTNALIQLNANGTLNLEYKNRVVYSNLFLTGYAPITGGRFAIGARTGGLNANHWIDDLSITTVLAGAPAAPTIKTQTQSLTVAERSSASFSVLPEGTPPFTFQWFSNNVAIAGATNINLTIENVPFSASGAKIKVDVANAIGKATSTEATLTVNPDTVAPTIAKVQGSESFDTVLVTFSEPVTAASAGDRANFTLSGGLSISAATLVSPTTVRLTTSAQAQGTNYTLTVSNVKDTATNPNTIAANSTASFTAFVLSSGFLKFEFWGNIGGNPVQDLLNDPRFQANTPDLTGFITSFDSRSIFADDSHESYGARISGFIIPNESGQYDFMLRSDDASQLYLSTDASTNNLELVAEETGCCDAFKEPGSGEETTATPRSLVAGQRYAVVVLYKEGVGGDYGQVAWRKEGDTTPAGQLRAIPGTFLASFADPGAASITFTQQPADVTAKENRTATFTVAATGSPAPVAFQWQRAEPASTVFTNIPGATRASYTTPILKRATDNGAKYRVVVSVPGASATSAEATLSVEIDITPPSIARVSPGENFKSVTVEFSEPVDPVSAATPANYTIPGLTISAAKLVNPTTVRLTTSAQTEGTQFTLTVSSNVTDTAIPPNRIDPAGSRKAFTALLLIVGVTKFEAYTGIGSTAVSELIASPKFPDAPDDVRLLAGFDSPNGFGENFGARMSGFVIPSETAEYDFFIRSDDASQLFISTDDDPANLSASPIAQETGCCRAFQEPGDPATTASPIRLAGGQRYFLVALYKEAGGGDYAQVAMRKAGDATPADQLRPISGSLVAASVDKTILDKITLASSLATPLGSGDASKPGFKARVHQVDQIGDSEAVNLVARAEQQLAGILGTNIANLPGAVDGFFNIDTVINWNESAGTDEQGNFQDDSTPPKPDALIPGIPGNATVEGHKTDSIAAEIITYVEFPTAGLYFMGVNSDDGFKVTAADTPPVNNGALVVSAPSSVAGAFYAVSSGTDNGGVYRPITQPITGKLVYADPPEACSDLLNPEALKGNIALIDRGVCTFSSKIQRAKDAGAIAVVMVNSRDPGSADGKFPIIMTGALVDLPAVMISKPDGAIIKTALAQGVQVSITPDSTPALGEFNSGRGAADSIFPINIPAPGIYPLRAIWFEGEGGANIEWFTLTSGGQKVLINDTDPGALKAFRARTELPKISSPTIAGGNITIQWTGGGTLQSTPSLTPPITWSDSGTGGRVTEAISGSAKFYRVRR